MTKEEAIYKVLKQTDLSNLVGGRVYPLVIPHGTQAFPFCVFSQFGRAMIGTKDDGYCAQNLTVAVSIVSKSYQEAHSIASTIPDVFFTDQAEEFLEQGGCFEPEFSSESEQYDMATDSFMVKVEMNLEYYPSEVQETTTTPED